MMLLGMGADGHVGSLYPNKPTLAPTTAWVLPFQKSPDAASITLSLPVMGAGKRVVICLTGDKKVRGEGWGGGGTGKGFLVLVGGLVSCGEGAGWLSSC